MERCPICIEHPGWAHGDERHRSEPQDACKGCLGSGVAENLGKIDVRVLLRVARQYSIVADAALADEHEENLRVAVLRLANVTDALRRLVTTW